MFLPEAKGEADKKKKRHRCDVLPLYIKVVISCLPGLFNSMNILPLPDKHPVLGLCLPDRPSCNGNKAPTRTLENVDEFVCMRYF